MNVAFLGLGIMGSQMAANIAKSGIRLKAWNRTEKNETTKLIEESGGIVTSQPEEALTDADIICLCFTDEKAINELFFEQKSLVNLISNKGAIVIDFSTNGSIAAISLSDKFSQNGISFLDAPVTGGDIGAKKGTLTVMVGGDKNAFNEAMPVFNSIGRNVYYCGETGNGQKIKTINQLLVAVNMLGVSEALLMAEKMDLPPNLVIDICSSGAAGSWALENLGKRIINNDFGPGFMLRHILKDLEIVKKSTSDNGIVLPALDLSQKMFKEAEKIQQKKNVELGTQAMFLAYKEANMLNEVLESGFGPKPSS